MFNRHFTTEGIHPYDAIQWKKFDAVIPGSKFEQKGVEFPEFFSQNAVNIVSQKYFAGALDSDDREYSFKQLVDRVVDTITLWGIAQGYFGQEVLKSFCGWFFSDDTESKQELFQINVKKQPWDFFDNIKSLELGSKSATWWPGFEPVLIFNHELKYMIINQMGAFNSPVWFNLGNKFNKQQISACFIVGTDDTIESIADRAATEMQVFRSGSGAGSNNSKLRSSKETISGGGMASGPNSFMKIYDQVANVTKSGGKSRRAAKMEILDIDHGDILEFIEQKSEEEKKAHDLIDAGHNSAFDDPKGAYGSVFFQNSNQSVRVTDTFMEAVENNEDWALLERKPVSGGGFQMIKEISQGYVYQLGEGGSKYIGYSSGVAEKYYKVIEWISAKELMDKISQSAWSSAEPGIQFHDIINKWHTCKNDGEIAASNPCSEYMFLDDTSCNLASHNLVKYYGDNGFDIDAYQYHVRLTITAMDILIGYADYPTKKIAEETKKYRTLGLGYSNLGALLMRKGLAYNSEDGRDYAAAITALMHNTAYNQSNKLAQSMGPFEGYKDNGKSMQEVIDMHSLSSYSLLSRIGEGNDLVRRAIIEIEEITDDDNDEKYFLFRNAQVTVLAPTGTISFIMDCETTGIEPAFSLVVYKTLVGGGVLTLTMPSVKKALEILGETESDIEIALEQIENGDPIEDIEVISKEDHPIFATAIGSNSIPWEAHISMMAAVQPFLSGAISKTINMPEESTVQDIKDAYRFAYNLELKSVSIYRDNCKKSQPMSDKKKDEKEGPLHKAVRESGILQKAGEKLAENKDKQIVEHYSNGRPKPIRRKLPDECESVRTKFSVGGVEGYFHVGLYPDGSPGEIFIRTAKQGSTINGFLEWAATAISLGLQHGVPIETFIDKSKGVKFEPSGMTNSNRHNMRFADSIPDFLALWLEDEFVEKEDEYIKEEDDGVNYKTEPEEKQYNGNICHYCGGLTKQSGTCTTCTQCGETTGCG